MARPKASALSDNPADKLFACLNYPVIKASADYVSAPSYFDAYRAWYDRLSWKHRGIVALVISAHTDRDGVVAERFAADLPPARDVRSETAQVLRLASSVSSWQSPPRRFQRGER